ncbi:MAG: hypothetical protein EOO38_03395 [Cytophagaceae bacterium]|nr:MAG: hypothetical protein EOO38_03395 [Cytophagaceae bacterium]
MYGPFQPPSACSVPIWLALSLKRKRKCRIVCPDWLVVGESASPTPMIQSSSVGPSIYWLTEIEKLQALLKDEKENAEGFEPLPRRFLETSKILLDM